MELISVNNFHTYMSMLDELKVSLNELQSDLYRAMNGQRNDLETQKEKLLAELSILHDRSTFFEQISLNPIMARVIHIKPTKLGLEFLRTIKRELDLLYSRKKEI